jgi:subtilisin-like proprotein convertase family protein
VLRLEANPKLTWRDVQNILIRTAKSDGLDPGDWEVNGAGLRVSYRVGFGVVDASAAVAMASRSPLLFPSLHVSLPFSNFPFSIPLYSTRTPLSIFAEYDFSMEHVEVVLSLFSDRSNDITMILTSPMGTKSVLVKSRNLRQSVRIEVERPSVSRGVYSVTPSSMGPPFVATSMTGLHIHDDLCGDDVPSVDPNWVIVARHSHLCTYQHQILNAQRAGAIGVIFISSNDAFVLDGSDVGVTIPSGMMSNKEGEKLREHANKQIFGNFRVDLNHHIGASYDSWTFTTVRHWGEKSYGNWTIEFIDDLPEFGFGGPKGDPIVVVRSCTIVLYGHSDDFGYLDPLYIHQWHLHNSPHQDLSIVPAWSNRVTGSGVTIGLIGKGFDTSHPEFLHNFASQLSNTKGKDEYTTAIAGLIAAEGNNRECGVGVAPQSRLVGVYLMDESDSGVANGLGWMK